MANIVRYTLCMKNITAILISPDGSAENITLSPEINSIWKTVGNWVEVVIPSKDSPTKSWRAYCDEEGRMKGLPENPVGTRLAKDLGWIGQVTLVGPMLFVGVDSHSNDTDVPSYVAEALEK